MAMWAGYNLKVDLATTPYAVQRVVVRDAAPAQDVSNTEGQPGNSAAGLTSNPAFSSALGGQSQATVELTKPTFDDAADPYAAPLSAVPGTWVACVIYLNGRGAPSKKFTFSSLLITEVEMNGDVKTLEPLTLRAVSDGPYTRPV